MKKIHICKMVTITTLFLMAGLTMVYAGTPQQDSNSGYGQLNADSNSEIGPGQIYVFGTGPNAAALKNAAIVSKTQQNLSHMGLANDGPGWVYIFGTADRSELTAKLNSSNAVLETATNQPKCSTSPGSIYVLGTGQQAALAAALTGSQCG